MTREEQLLFGERIRKARIDATLTQERVSGEIGISLRFYQMIERGEKNMSIDTLIGLSKTLNVSLDYLLLGGLSVNLSNPISEIFDKLSLPQKAAAVEILRLYRNACVPPQTEGT